MRRLLLLPVLALVALFLAATPASAATVTEFTIGGSSFDRTSVVGAELPVQAVVDAVSADLPVSAEQIGTAANNPGVSDWGGPAGENPGGGEFNSTITFRAAGTYTFAYVVREDGQPDATSRTITVTVLPEGADPVVTPAPRVTFPDTCTIVLPDTANTTYEIDGPFGSDDVPAGTYDLASFYAFGEAVTFTAVPADGTVFPDGARTSFEVTPSASCFPQLVGAESVCRAVEFTNTTDGTVDVAVGSRDEEGPSSEFELAAGATRSVPTDSERVLFQATTGGGAEPAFQAGALDVDQVCAPGEDGGGTPPADSDDAAAPANAAFPTVAPAAGSDQASSTGPTGLLALLALAGAAVVGGPRLLRRS